MNDKIVRAKVRKMSDACLAKYARGTPIGQHPVMAEILDRWEVQPSRGVCLHCGGGLPEVIDCKYCGGTGIDLS